MSTYTLTPEDNMFNVFLKILDKTNSIMKVPSYMKKGGYYYMSGLFSYFSSPHMTPMTLTCNIELDMFNKKEQNIIQDFFNTEAGSYFDNNYFTIFPIELYQYIKDNKKEINRISFIEGQGIKLSIYSSSLKADINSFIITELKNEPPYLCYIESNYDLESVVSIDITDFDMISTFLRYKGIMELVIDGNKKKVYFDEDKSGKNIYKIDLTNKILTGSQGMITASSTDIDSTMNIEVYKLKSIEDESISVLNVVDITFNLNDKNGNLKRAVVNRFLIVSY
jgi:hypothetical protein